MRIAKSIDYITLSRVGHGSREFPAMLKNEAIRREEYTGSNAFYEHNWKLENGGTFSMSDDSNQGQRLELPGGALRSIREIITEDELLINVAMSGMRATRLDFAIDVLGSKHSPLDCITEYNNGRMQSKARTAHKYDELSGDGLTMYVGSKSSDRRLRIYDKSAEMGLLGEAWTRVELQTRKQRANSLMNDMLSQGIHSVGTQAIIEYVDFPSLEWWCDAMGNDANVHISELPRSKPAFQKWLETQVLPACRKRIGTNEEFIVHEFLAQLTTMASCVTSDTGTSDKRG